MKILVVLALALATVSAELYSREMVVPAIEQDDGRITNGQQASPGQFPYQVGISMRVSTLSTAWCGGSLISNKWVLTAAHCTDGILSATIYLGATARTSAEVTYSVSNSQIIIHSGWNSKTLLNDISLIEIPAVANSGRISPVQIPSNNNNMYVGESVVASGWGRMSDASNSVASNLQYAYMTVASSTPCARTFGSVFQGGTTICVETPKAVSTCNGDSGGPLVLTNSRIQIGLTSYGAAAGCEKGYPVVFTRVSSYLAWIKQHTGIAY